VGDAPPPQAYGFDESLVSFEGLGERILPPGGLSDASAKLGRGTIRRVEKHEQTGVYVDRAIDFMRRNSDSPFFVRLFPNDVHDGHHPAPGSEEKWKAVTDNPFEQRFFAVLEELDLQIGRLVDAVDSLGLAERTLIVFTSDNGPTDWPFYYKQGWNPPGFTGPLFGRKWCLYEGGIRMPFIARWPGVIPAGEIDDETVMCGIDLAPTFCRLAGADVPGEIVFDGEDMSRALLDGPVRRQRPIFWQYGTPHAECRPGDPRFVSPSLAVMDGNWKLLADPGGTSAQLFDLAADPGETVNLLVREPGKARTLWAELRRWAGEMGFETSDGDLVPPAARPESRSLEK
jgi:arylsulfatase A-like enzyme